MPVFDGAKSMLESVISGWRSRRPGVPRRPVSTTGELITAVGYRRSRRMRIVWRPEVVMSADQRLNNNTNL